GEGGGRGAGDEGRRARGARRGGGAGGRAAALARVAHVHRHRGSAHEVATQRVLAPHVDLPVDRARIEDEGAAAAELDGAGQGDDAQHVAVGADGSAVVEAHPTGGGDEDRRGTGAP